MHRDLHIGLKGDGATNHLTKKRNAPLAREPPNAPSVYCVIYDRSGAMRTCDAELLAITDIFRSLASRWGLSVDEVDILLGLDIEGCSFTGGGRLSVAVETRMRLLCELDGYLCRALKGRDIGGWLRCAELELDPLTFLSLGTEEIRAMLTAARCRVAQTQSDKL